MSYSNNKPKSINCFLFLKNRLRNLMWKWSKVPIAKQKIMMSENPSQQYYCQFLCNSICSCHISKVIIMIYRNLEFRIS